MTGLLITFEGIEGCGKTTQLETVAQRLTADNHEVLCLREPGGTRTGEEIRRILLHSKDPICDATEALLFMASRAQIVHEVIQPALERGCVVLCDRFLHSSLAYQGTARGLGMTAILGLNDFALQGVLPDLTLFIDVTVEEGLSRAKGRDILDRIEQEDIEFHYKVRGAFRTMGDPRGRFVTIDGMGTKEETAERVWEALAPILG